MRYQKIRSNGPGQIGYIFIKSLYEIFVINNVISSLTFHQFKFKLSQYIYTENFVRNAKRDPSSSICKKFQQPKETSCMIQDSINVITYPLSILTKAGGTVFSECELATISLALS